MRVCRYCFAEDPETGEIFCVCMDLLPKIEEIMNKKLKIQLEITGRVQIT